MSSVSYRPRSSFFFFPSPNKTEFIKAKYQMLAYVHRMPCREDDSVTAKDLSKVSSSPPSFMLQIPNIQSVEALGRKRGKVHLNCLWLFCVCPSSCLFWWINTLFASISVQQLHSSVRTGNLETCLRLLSLGAQANFFHQVAWAKKKKAKQKSIIVFPTNVCFFMLGMMTGERKYPTTYSSKSRANSAGRAVGGLRRWPGGPGFQREDPHRLRKVKESTRAVCDSSFILDQHIWIFRDA